MPAERMDAELLSVWMEQTPSVEIAEMAAFNLYQYVDGVSDSAFEWIASENDICQICGYNVLARLLKRGFALHERDMHELEDQAQSAIACGSLQVRRAAAACMMSCRNE